MKPRRIMMLVHTTLVPPRDLRSRGDPRLEKYRTEHEVKRALQRRGHDVRIVGVYDDIAPIRRTVEEWRPHVAFNLLDDFAGNGGLDYYVVSLLEMLRVRYTGCNPRGLLLARDKALSKKILAYHRIAVPEFTVFPHRRRIARLPPRRFPMIVKSLTEHGSVGIARASRVRNQSDLRARVRLIHEQTGGDAIAESYIEGRELYVTVLGNARREVLPVRELAYTARRAAGAPLATYRVKWDPVYCRHQGIAYRFARLAPSALARVGALCRRVCQLLDINGYARIDLRLTEHGECFVLEANPNPGIARNEDSTLSARKAGLAYEDFIERLLQLALSSPTLP